MAIWIYTLVSTLLISLLGLLGIVTLYLNPKQLRALLLPLVGFAAGGLLGNVFLDLLPELVERRQGLDPTSSLLIIAGIVGFFLLEQGIRQWQEQHPEAGDHTPHSCHIAGHGIDEEHGEHEEHEVHEAHKHAAGVALLRARPFALVNVGGDLVHNFIDGLAVGAAYLVDVHLGLATTLAVVLHEIPHELGNFAVLIHAGLGRKRALLYNFLTALTAVAGGMVAMAFGRAGDLFPLYLLPFTAGSFIYLAAADLLPELLAHSHPGRVLPGLLGLAGGIGIMVLLLFVAGH